MPLPPSTPAQRELRERLADMLGPTLDRLTAAAGAGNVADTARLREQLFDETASYFGRALAEAQSATPSGGPASPPAGAPKDDTAAQQMDSANRSMW